MPFQKGHQINFGKRFPKRNLDYRMRMKLKMKKYWEIHRPSLKQIKALQKGWGWNKGKSASWMTGDKHWNWKGD